MRLPVLKKTLTEAETCPRPARELRCNNGLYFDTCAVRLVDTHRSLREGRNRWNLEVFKEIRDTLPMVAS